MLTPRLLRLVRPAYLMAAGLALAAVVTGSVVFSLGVPGIRCTALGIETPLQLVTVGNGYAMTVTFDGSPDGYLDYGMMDATFEAKA